tara:strand:- start:591 stop:812 length:222 start_codon:yes stop_codon:yes gene_type:complete
MKIGDLLRYWKIEGAPALGLVTKDPATHPDSTQVPVPIVVEVFWYDDCSYTYEELENVLDPEEQSLEVVSEAR